MRGISAKGITVAIAITTLVAASAATAREDFSDFDVKEAVESSVGQNKLLDVPFFMKGQKHKKVTKKLGVYPSNKRTNAFGKSDEVACQIAFLSAIISLQKRAQSLGADAVVDIRSITRHNDLESATQFRCVAGNVVANVALEGRMVKLSK